MFTYSTIMNGQILWLRFKDYGSAGLTMLRVQEFYESPYTNIRGKFGLTHLDIIREYVKQTGTFDYFDKVAGYNIPTGVAWPILYREDTLSIEEGLLFEALNADDAQYLIATIDKDYEKWTLDHELSHALWFLVPEYKAEAAKLLADLGPTFEPMARKLRKTYAGEVVLDEMVAYLATCSQAHLKKEWGCCVSRKTIQTFRNLLAYFIQSNLGQEDLALVQPFLALKVE